MNAPKEMGKALKAEVVLFAKSVATSHATASKTLISCLKSKRQEQSRSYSPRNGKEDGDDFKNNKRDDRGGRSRDSEAKNKSRSVSERKEKQIYSSESN